MRKHFSQRSAKGISECRRHFLRRLAERYGLSITQDQYQAACRDVRAGAGRFLEKESLTRTHWLIRVSGKPVRAVYDKRQSALVTALPLGVYAASAIEAEGEGAVQQADAPDTSA